MDLQLHFRRSVYYPLKLGFTYPLYKSIPLPQSSFQTICMVISLGRLLCLLIASWYSLKVGSIFGLDIDVYTGQNISDRTSIFLVLVEYLWILQKKTPSCSIPVHSRCPLPLPFVHWPTHSAQAKIKVVYYNHKIALVFKQLSP